MAQIMNEAGEPIVTSEKHGYVTVVTLNRCSCPAFFFLRCSGCCSLFALYLPARIPALLIYMHALRARRPERMNAWSGPLGDEFLCVYPHPSPQPPLPSFT